MTEDNNRNQMIDFLSEVIRYIGSVEKNMASTVLIPEQAKRMDSANNRISKKIAKLKEELNVEFLNFVGSQYSAELPVEALNLEDFSNDAILVVVATIEPTIKEKDSSHVIKFGKVLVAEYKG